MINKIWLIALSFILFSTNVAEAQLFGNRTLGNSLSRRQRQGNEEMIQGNERFLRGNRRGNNFIGTDTRDRRGFVGSLSSEIGPVRRNQNLRPVARTPANINPPRPAPKTSGIYESRLTLGSEISNYLPMAQRMPEVAKRLERSEALQSLGRIEISTVGRTAILRGEAFSVQQRALAAILVSFEPEIVAVKNELVVRQGAPPVRKESASTKTEAPAAGFVVPRN